MSLTRQWNPNSPQDVDYIKDGAVAIRNLKTDIGERYGVPVDQYDSLASCIAAVGTDRALLIASEVAIPAGTTTITNPVYVAPGGLFNCTGDLALNGPFTAGLYQVFDGDGSVAGLKEAHPEWFGIDNIDDSVAINKALQSAEVVTLSSHDYHATNPIKLPSGKTLIGKNIHNTRIYSTYDGPIIVSQNYLSAEGVSPTGGARVSTMMIVGDAASTNQEAILLRDYYSTIDNLVMSGTLKHSIHLTATNDVGTPVGGTLVNNRVKTVRTYNCGSMLLGEDDNNKLTDGVLDDAIISIAAGSDYALFIGSAAGWFIDKIHTEGNTPTENSICISNSYKTNIGSVYCESGGVSGKAIVSFTKCQHPLNINSLSMSVSTSGAIGLTAGRSSIVSEAKISIGNLNITNSGASAAVTGVSINTSTVSVAVANKMYQNTNPSPGTITDSYSALGSRLDSTPEFKSWTPTVYGSTTAGTYTVTINSAHYVKIGNLVKCFADISFSAASGGVGNLTIGGWPYTMAIGTIGIGTVITYQVNFSAVPNSVALYRANTAIADNRAIMLESVDSAAYTATPITALSTSSRLIFCFEYMTFG